MKCDLKVKRFRLWQIASRNRSCPADDPLLRLSCIEFHPSWVNLGCSSFLDETPFQGFEVVMWTKQTNSCIVQLEAHILLVQVLGCHFCHLPRRCLLYPAASKAIKHFEGSYPYKVQRESWQIKRPNSQESDTHSDLACWSEWLERWRFVNVLKSLKGNVKWKP